MRRATSNIFASTALIALSCIFTSAQTQSLSAPVYGHKVIQTYPHDPNAYTEGLIYLNGALYESTGLFKQSSLRKVDLTTGNVLQILPLASNLWGEGLISWGNTLVQVTQGTSTGFVYDLASFRQLKTFQYSGNGWGLTSDGQQLIMSDGTCDLRFLDPTTFRETKRVCVTDGGNPVTNINELEYVYGRVYANIDLTNLIAVIFPSTGKVLAWIDLTGLYPGHWPNGIAYDPQNGRIFVTGKYWPNLYWIQYMHK
jgi:glutamine cyclotransferase